MKNTWLAAVMNSDKLASPTKTVAAVLWTYARIDGTSVHPAQSLIARKAVLSVTTVKIGLAELERHGWLARDGTKPSGRGRPVVVYRLSTPIE